MAVQPSIYLSSCYLLYSNLVWGDCSALEYFVRRTLRVAGYGCPISMSPKPFPPYEDKFMRFLKADQLKIQNLLADTSNPTLESEVAREWILIGH